MLVWQRMHSNIGRLCTETDRALFCTWHPCCTSTIVNQLKSAGSGAVALEFMGETYQVVRSSQAQVPWGILRRIKQSTRGERWECAVCDSVFQLLTVLSAWHAMFARTLRSLIQVHADASALYTCFCYRVMKLYHLGYDCSVLSCMPAKACSAGSKTSCKHAREAGAAPSGEGLSSDAYAEELKGFQGPDGKRALTCKSREHIPEEIEKSPLHQRYQGALVQQ